MDGERLFQVEGPSAAMAQRGDSTAGISREEAGWPGGQAESRMSTDHGEPPGQAVVTEWTAA